MDARRWNDFNLYLFISVLVLLGFGSAMVYSTTIGSANADSAWTLSSPFVRHLIWLGIGGVAMIVLTLLDYHILQLLAKPFYVATILILVFILAAGQIGGGAQSWLFGGANGSASGQPAELAKLLLIISLAAWWSRRDEDVSSWWTLIGSLVIAGIPLLLVFAQPDFGTAMVIGGTWFAMAWAAGMTWRQTAVLGLIALPVLYVGWHYVLQDYQQGRLLGFAMTPEEVAQIKNPVVRESVERVFYNVQASKVTIGNGGPLGQGLLNGTMTQRNFLPVQWTDFIFAATAEELGFVGATAMLAFICIVLWQAVTIASRARDTFGRLIAVGVFGMLLVHTVENIGMNLGVMPVTGIPLPFISYGGSFAVTVLACMGVLFSIDMRRRALVF